MNCVRDGHTVHKQTHTVRPSNRVTWNGKEKKKKLRTSLKMYLAFSSTRSAESVSVCIMQIVHLENIIISLDTATK